MKVLVCGGRDYSNWQRVYDTLDDCDVTLLIQGGAAGADRHARCWAEDRRVPFLQVPAQWERYGRSAGVLRNAQMLDHEPDLVIAFPGGPGTADMVRRARARNVTVREVI